MESTFLVPRLAGRPAAPRVRRSPPLLLSTALAVPAGLLAKARRELGYRFVEPREMSTDAWTWHQLAGGEGSGRT